MGRGRGAAVPNELAESGDSFANKLHKVRVAEETVRLLKLVPLRRQVKRRVEDIIAWGEAWHVPGIAHLAASLYRRFKNQRIQAVTHRTQEACKKLIDLGVLNQEILRLLEGKDVEAPIAVLDLHYLLLGEKHEFLSEMAPVFPELPWDEYDVRRKWVEALEPFAKESDQALLRKYYQGEVDLSALQSLKEQLPSEKREALEALRPWRQRGIGRVRASLEGERHVNFEFQDLPNFQQGGAGDADIRTLPRSFASLPEEIFESRRFQRLLKNLVWYVWTCYGETKALEITVHFMGVVARPGFPGDNAPEGHHQDGSDFIVSALVVNRDNVVGGESVVFAKPDDIPPQALASQHEVFRRTLAPGEMLFQSDTSSGEEYGQPLYHGITPFQVVDTSRDGRRDIIGFDINVVN